MAEDGLGGELAGATVGEQGQGALGALAADGVAQLPSGWAHQGPLALEWR